MSPFRILLAAALLAVTVGAAAAMPLRDPTPRAAPDRGQRPPCAILLHGLGRTARSMTPLARALQRDGYVVANIDYPSREQRIEALAAEALPRGLDLCRQAQAAPIHVVTHSMGGILTRHYLGAHEVPELGRVVMLGPPNRGSAVADRLMDTAAYRRFNGPVPSCWPVATPRWWTISSRVVFPATATARCSSPKPASKA